MSTTAEMKTEWLLLIAKHHPEILVGEVMKGNNSVHANSFYKELKSMVNNHPLPNPPNGQNIKSMLIAACDRRIKRAVVREHLNALQQIQCLPFKVRMEPKVITAVHTAYKQCGNTYRAPVPRYGFGGRNELLVMIDTNAKIDNDESYRAEGLTKKVWRYGYKYSRNNSEHRITVPLGWYVSVFRKGLGCLQGHLVLRATPMESLNGVKMYAIKYVQQSVGFKIKVADGFAAVANDTSAISGTARGAVQRLRKFLKRRPQQ
jgi:hypothetical protein